MNNRIYVADKDTLDEVNGKADEIKASLQSVKEDTAKIEASIMSVSSGGIAPDNMRFFSVQPADGKVKIKFQEPKDTYIDDQLICTWKGVKIVMKEGGYPENEADGTVILDCTIAGKYAEDYFEHGGLTNDTQYFFQAFPYSDYGIYNRNAVNRAIATPQAYVLYGFKIAKKDSNPATRVTYTEMAVGKTPAKVNLSTGSFDYGDWADAWFVRDNVPCMVKNDGTIDYELDSNDYTKKKDGTGSDVSNSSYGGNAMSKIPLSWLKQWEDTNYYYCNICNIQLTDDYKAFAHMRADGSVMDYTFLSCFEGSLVSSKIRSIKGLTPCNTQAGTNEITYAKANGNLWYTRTWSQRNLINMLLILMACSTNTQEAYGYGYYTGGSSSSPNYLQTGGASDKGQFYGTNATRNYVKVFHIENWWGDVWERIAGLIYDTSGKYKVKMYPNYNTDGSGYDVMSFGVTGTSGGYVSADNMSEHGMLPITVSGSETTYDCDGCWFNTSQSNYAIVGGSSDYGLRVGALCVSVACLVSASAWAIGVALSCEQPVAA